MKNTFGLVLSGLFCLPGVALGLPLQGAARAQAGQPPAWVIAGGGTCQVSRRLSNKTITKPALCGVGKVTGIRNLSLARQTADGRARLELIKIRDRYLGHIRGVVPTQPAVGKTMVGTTIERRWRDPRTGALYSLAALEVAQ